MAVAGRQAIAYLAETAEQAGKTVELMDIGEIGFSEQGRWEWMAGDPFFADRGVTGYLREMRTKIPCAHRFPG